MSGAWLVALLALGARAAFADASVQGGGMDLFARLSTSPGTPRAARSEVAFDTGLPVAGTGVHTAGLEALVASGPASASVGASTIVTPVGASIHAAGALQVRGDTWRLGASIVPRNWRFEGYAGSWDVVVRAGAGWTAPHAVEAVLRFERTPGVPPALAVAFSIPIPGEAQLEAQAERVPGRPTRVRAALTSSRTSFAWRVGFDLETESASLGCTWRWQRLALTWGARTHPHLGWSHAWTVTHAL